MYLSQPRTLFLNHPAQAQRLQKNCQVFEEPRGSGPAILEKRKKKDEKDGGKWGKEALHIPGLMLFGHLLLDVTIRQPVTNAGRDLVERAPLDLRVTHSNRS
jgi:hypothetical protein